jgi:hypothetical protein
VFDFIDQDDALMVGAVRSLGGVMKLALSGSVSTIHSRFSIGSSGRHTVEFMTVGADQF